MRSKLHEQIDAIFSDYDKAENPGCAVAVIRDGSLIHSKGYGYANLEHDIPITSKTVFHCASMGKQFTAMCIALLEEAGKITATDDVRQYLPELPDYGETLTVANLLHMTNGLYDIYNLANYMLGIREDDYFTAEQAWEMVKACDWLMFRPGERWSYGNTGYFLLGEIVERVSGQTLSEFADRNIFRPLGMTSTCFRDDRAMLIKHRAESYSDYAHVHYNDQRPSYFSAGQKYAINADLMSMPGAGGMWTTIEDLCKWDENFYQNCLGKGSAKLIKKVTTSGQLNDGSPVDYGYGLFLRSKSGFDYAYHGGSANGWSSAIYRIPEQRFSVICLGNHTSLGGQIGVNPGSYSLLDRVAELVITGYHARPDVSSEVDATVAETAQGYSELAGEYQDPDNSWLWHITLEDGKLKVRENYFTEFELKPVSDDTCEGPTGSLRVHLVREHGQVTRLQARHGEKASIYYRFLRGISQEALNEYAGDYYCYRIMTGFSVSVEAGRLKLRNHNRRNTGIDLNYRPTIKDNFVGSAPPYCTWYCITFQRDQQGRVVSFTYRDDEGSRRENLVFMKCKHEGERDE